MIKSTTMRLLFTALTCLISLSVYGQLTYVPDPVFEQYLINAGFDDELDAYVATENIELISSIYIQETHAYINGVAVWWDASDPWISAPPIFNLIGINDFLLLQTLDCRNQYLSSINLSELIYLQYVDLSGNYLECINIDGCISLSQLYLNGNFLSQLDLSSCISLNIWECEFNANPFLTCVQISEYSNTYEVDNYDVDFLYNCEYDEILDCSAMTSEIQEYSTDKKLIKILDQLGREVNHTTNQILFHIYDDGSVEKKFIVE